MTYADILLPLPLPRAFTYLLPDDRGEVGMRARVPFGKRKVCEGIVLRLHDTPPESKNPPKTVLEILDDRPIVRPSQLRLWEWMADYYLCTPGEVFKAAVPSGIRDGSYRPTAELYVRLAAAYRSAPKIAETLEAIRRAKSQCKALLSYLSFLPTGSDGEPILAPDDPQTLWVARADLTETLPAAIVLRLVERGILEQQEIVPSALRRAASQPDPSPAAPTIAASPLQPSVDAAFRTDETLLLSGDAAADRETLSRLYIALANGQMRAGRQTLLLMPDTVLSVPLTNSLQSAFGPRCLVYHSRLTDRARCAAWQRMIDQPESVGLVVGTRSALFLPFDRLGLVIVDREHDPNYRQSDPAPRYHARDTALMLARLHRARTLLVSPTPSAESWLNACAEGGKYRALAAPAGDRPPTKTTILERGRGIVSTYLRRRIDETLQAGRQIVLFQNRRGFSPYVECAACGATPSCPRCNVTLAYHKETSTLACHYCGWIQPYSSACPSCGMQTLVPRGIGTERIEEQIAELFPDTRIARMDTDTMRGTGAAARIAADFAQGETQLLVGTQMVARTAPDSDQIGLVGVVHADNLLSRPDFRAAERAFQLLMQLKSLLPADGSGELIIQSAQRLHPALLAVANHDADGFYRREMQERHDLLYPPYVRMLRLTFRHREKPLVAAAAEQCAAQLRERFGRRVSPPYEPQVDRIQNQHILRLLLRIERDRPVARAKAILLQTIENIRRAFPKVRITAEADPL